MRLVVNGEERRGIAEPRTLLSDFLRHGARADRDARRLRARCLRRMHGAGRRRPGTLVSSVRRPAQGARVETVEGLATGDELHPMQQAFHEQHGLQCGYCTPGLLLARVDLLERNPDPSEEEIRDYLAGNVCRCTGYVGIVAAVQSAAAAWGAVLMAQVEAKPYVGQRILRLEDPRLLRGLRPLRRRRRSCPRTAARGVRSQPACARARRLGRRRQPRERSTASCSSSPPRTSPTSRRLPPVSRATTSSRTTARCFRPTGCGSSVSRSRASVARPQVRRGGRAPARSRPSTSDFPR